MTVEKCESINSWRLTITNTLCRLVSNEGLATRKSSPRFTVELDI